MKTKYMILPVLAFFLAACNDFLKEDSADLIIPESVNDFAPLLLGEGYPDQFASQVDWGNLISDDVEMGPLHYDLDLVKNITEGNDPNVKYGEFAYSWQADMSERITDKFWGGRYNNILGCNVIIHALPTMTYAPGEEGKYNKLAAQAHALRAYHYFCLVNTYALPYSEQNRNELGVIIRTSPEIDIKSKERATIEEVYKLINDDLTKAREYIAKAIDVKTKREITPAAIYFLASRVALFQGDWDGVIKASGQFMEEGNALYDLNQVDETTMGTKGGFRVNREDIEETVFLFAKNDKEYAYMAPFMNYQYYELGFHPSWTGDQALLNIYEEGDLRRSAYFMKMYEKDQSGSVVTHLFNQACPFKSQKHIEMGESREAWRSPEVYLNLAEAYAQKASGVSEEAVNWLNKLRIKKFKSSAYVAKSMSDFTSKDQLIEFIREERRRELCFEELMRFWDIRRQGMPRMEHVYYYSKNTFKTFVLEKNSPNYVMPLPASETEVNQGVTNNPRVIIVAQEDK